jgi:hypothetical protein
MEPFVFLRMLAAAGLLHVGRCLGCSQYCGGFQGLTGSGGGAEVGWGQSGVIKVMMQEIVMMMMMMMMGRRREE